MTGGGSGIGLATCSRLAAASFTLAVLDLDLDAAKAAAGTDGTGLVADVSDADAVDQAFTDIFAAFRPDRRADQQCRHHRRAYRDDLPRDAGRRVGTGAGDQLARPVPVLAGGAAGDARAGDRDT